MFTWSERELNPEQTAAVLEPQSMFLIACPGSGKTRTLTYKIAYELSRLVARNAMVAAITYTHRAADEIHERIEDLGVDTNRLSIGTIHSFCVEWILKPYGIYEPDLAHGFRIIDQHERQVLLEGLCREDGRGVTFWDCDYYVTEDGYALGCVDARKHDALHDILGEYFTILASNRQLDFERILLYAHRLIVSRPIISHLLAQIFSMILIDEYQDTKRIQYAIVASIVRAGAGQTKVFIVGDPNQAIYGSLGGLALSAGEFRAMCCIPILDGALWRNYRSSDRIIGYFGHYKVEDMAIEAASADRHYPSLICYNEAIARPALEDELVRLIRLSIETHGFPPNEVCVLAPQWALLAGITRRLVAALPEYQFDGPGMVPFSRDPENFCYRLSRIVLTQASLGMYVRRLRWAAEAIRDLKDSGVNVGNLTTKGLLRECNSVECAEPNGLDYLRAVFSLLFQRLNIDLAAYPLLEEHHRAFFDSSQARIDRLTLEGSPFVAGIEFFRKVFQYRTGITVSTIHGVKGAEFDAVIAYGLLEGMVPHFSDPDADASARKMLYVVCSRARKNLFLISERERPRGRYNHYSPTERLAACVFAYDDV
jgi:DNA helicase-2/ATP-dependent DNA helicase PcrA